MSESNDKTYVGCRVVANIMGLHEETVRRRVVAGQIPGKLINGRWTFSHNELVKAKVLGFSPLPVDPKSSQAKPTKKKLHAFFVLDGSGSMSPLMSTARHNLRQQLAAMEKTEGVQAVATLVVFERDVKDVFGPFPVGDAKDLERLYRCYGGMTGLNDAILRALDLARQASSENDAVLVSILTDGVENSSQAPYSVVRGAVEGLSKRLSNFTITFAGPKQHSVYPHSIGIPPGNITQWEQTVEGLKGLGDTTVCSLNAYSANVSVGATRSISFYAQPVVSDPQAFANELRKELVKLDPSKDIDVVRVTNADPLTIRNFCTQKIGRFQKGQVFYQLTESEKVQEYKEILVQDTATGTFYKGWNAAKKLLGIPDFQGTIRIKPGALGEFKVFIQSTSVNRKLKPGTVVVRLR